MVSVGAAVIVAVGLFVYMGDKAVAISLKPDDVPTRERGNQVYSEYCASCHGANLEGQPNWKTPLETGRYPAPPHDRDGHTWHHPDELLFNLTKFGPSDVIGNGHESDMPGFKDQLSDQDIIAVLSFIKSAWPKVVRIRHDRLNEISKSKREAAE